jgi:hypothetical protein
MNNEEPTEQKPEPKTMKLGTGMAIIVAIIFIIWILYMIVR